MSEIYVGEIRDGVVVFEGPTPALPPGTKVRVEPILADEQSTPTLAERLKDVIGSVTGLPSDMAEQHDHYLHGTPKR
jgi:hypothetical protein